MTSAVLKRLLGVDRQRVVVGIQSGKTVAELAREFGCAWRTMKKVHDRLGLPLNVKGSGRSGPRPHTRYRAHWPAVIELRESGMTYQKIGDAFGITRERVRQILHAAGRSDLTKAHKARLKPLFDCAECGKKHERRHSPFCSRRCMRDFRKHAYYERDLPKAQKIAAMRQDGKKWQQIAIRFGHWPPETAVAWMTKFCDRHGREDLRDKATGFYVQANGNVRIQESRKRRA